MTDDNQTQFDKPIRLTKHAQEQCLERGTNEAEVIQAIRKGVGEPAKKNRLRYRYNFEYNSTWQNRHYAIKQVAPVIVRRSGRSCRDHCLHFLFLKSTYENQL